MFLSPSFSIQFCKPAATIALLVSVMTGWPVVSPSSLRAEVEQAVWVMYHEPEITTPSMSVSFPPNLVQLWSDALELPQLEMKRRACESIARAHQRGLPGLDATIPRLQELIEQPAQDREICLHAARALVTLDARQAAAVLMKSLSPADLDLAEIVEPALAKWSVPAAREMWLQRLASEIDFQRMHILAIEGLTALGANEAVPKLRELALTRHIPASVRLAAAIALGRLENSGLEDEATQLVQDRSHPYTVDRLAAAHLLASHRNEESRQILASLALDPSPSVQALALQKLFKDSPLLVMPLVDQTIVSPDANVRGTVAEALISVAATPSPNQIGPLCSLLNDLNPSLRLSVRNRLIELASDVALRETVIEKGRQVLNGDQWRGQEQATRLLVALDVKSTTDRLFELLESPRPEAHIAAAWGLCELNVPETADRIFEVFNTKSQQVFARQPQPEGTQTQLCHLAQSLGRMRYQGANEVLRKYVPKNFAYIGVLRAAAIWALSSIRVNEPDEALIKSLEARAEDLSFPSEDETVRRMAIVALGRLKAESSIETLKRLQYDLDLHEGPGIACSWSLQEITGEPQPPVPELSYLYQDWFLMFERTITAMPEDPRQE